MKTNEPLETVRSHCPICKKETDFFVTHPYIHVIVFTCSDCRKNIRKVEFPKANPDPFALSDDSPEWTI